MRLTRAAIAIFGLAIMPMAPAFASSFDGKWSVTQDCEGAPGGARPFKWSYDATVKDGNFLGQFGTRGQPSSLTLSGRVQADGTAALVASGLNGKSDYTVGFGQPGERFSYPVAARFDGKRGTGKRTQGRVCTFSFAKQ